MSSTPEGTVDEVQHLLGHASPHSSQVYLHPASQRLRDAVERVGGLPSEDPIVTLAVVASGPEPDAGSELGQLRGLLSERFWRRLAGIRCCVWSVRSQSIRY